MSVEVIGEGIRMFEVWSENDIQYYTVAVTEEGRAVSCSCMAGRHLTPCKHIYRVTARTLFKKACNRLISDGFYPDGEEVRLAFSLRREELGSIEDTMADFIRRVFPEHALANDWKRWRTTFHADAE